MDNLLADINILNCFTKDDASSIAREIKTALENESDLSKRSGPEIKYHIKKGELFCLFKKDSLAGFVISSTIRKDIVEVSGLFVKPEHRGSKLADVLMDAATAKPNIYYVAVTYNEKMRQKLTALGFQKTRFKEMKLGARVGILLSRAQPHRIGEILRHLGEKKQMTFFVK